MKKSDIASFLQQLNLPMAKEFTYPCDNVTIIKRALRNLATAYEQQDNLSKQFEVQQLLQLLGE